MNSPCPSRRRLVGALTFCVLTAALGIAAAGSARAVPAGGSGAALAARVAQATPTVALLIDDFEEADWPSGTQWTITMDPEDPRTLFYTWAPRPCRASSGRQSLWAVGGGERGQALACGDPYPPNIRSAVVLALDLRPYADAKVLRLAFDMWGDTISDAALGDFFSVNYMMTTAEGYVERVLVLDWTGATGPAFRTERLDLLDLPDVHDESKRYRLAGKQVEMEFVFRTARDSSFRPEGVYVDNVRLERDGVPTATSTAATATATMAPPSATVPPATATATAPATVTRAATTTVSPTGSPGGGAIYLPVARRRS